jgi:hypothetical protein
MKAKVWEMVRIRRGLDKGPFFLDKGNYDVEYRPIIV